MNLLFKEPKLSFCTLNFEQYKYVKESKKELLLPDLTPAGVNSLYMGVAPRPPPRGYGLVDRPETQADQWRANIHYCKI